jgi:hypothetical protein
MAEDHELLERIGRLSERASSGSEGSRLLAEIEDVLAEGYLIALNAEARSRRLAERAETLVEQLDEPDAALELRRLSAQRRGLEQRTRMLRSHLAVMREHFVRLGGAQSAYR